jgi:non-specific serine/threonine protein kinase
MTPPAASCSAGAALPRPQLPADVSGFVGRSTELARLSDLLDSARLVTVAGPGGVGKTRLALRAAAGFSAGPQSRSPQSRSPQSRGTVSRGTDCCLVELSGLDDPELLADTVAPSLGISRTDAATPLEAVLGALRGRRLLLILDTCEHLAQACARFAAAVLRETAGVTILATSRQPLHVPGEQVLRLGPLPVPDEASAARGAGSGGGPGTPGSGDAVELFAQRAAAAVSGFRLRPADLPHVIRLCRHLDGIPLAIELAAVRVRVLPVAELAARVATGLAAGTGVRRGIVGRHQTMRAAIDWSYRLCTEAERATWRRLSVFAGTFDLTVADDVAAGDPVPAGQAAQILTGLIDKSVVLPAGPDRYRLPDSVREYGAGQLAAAGEQAEIRGRHLARYRRLVSDFSHRLLADGQQERLNQLRAEHANIRAALAFGLAGDRARDAARLAAALFPYWQMSGSIREGIHWQDKALESFPGPSAERASALANRALLGTTVGLPEAASQAAEAVALASQLGDEQTQARACLALQFALTTAGRYAEALETARQVRQLLEALGTEHALRTLDVQVAHTHIHLRDFDAALEYSRHVLSSLSPGERWLRGIGHALCALTYYLQSGPQDECAAEARAALLASQEIGSLVGAAYALEVIAWLAADAGRCQRAAWVLGAAQALWERTGGRLSGSGMLEGYHQQAAATVAGALGPEKYSGLHRAGAIRPLAQITALVAAGADMIPADPAGPSADEARGWRGTEGLTARELEIAQFVAQGLSNREIAERLVISKRTVDAHVNHIFAKLGMSSRVQLTIWLRDRVPVPPAGEVSPAAYA